MKKTLSMILALTMLLCCGMTACGSTQTGESATTTQAAQSTTEATAEATTAATTETEATTTAATTEAPAQNPDARDPSKSLNILFVGNSYTHYNDMPTTIFRPIATEAGYTVTVRALTEGGHHLSEFASEKDEKGAQLKKLLSAAQPKYDVVVLQEQSHTPTSNPARFYSGVRDLYKMIKEHNPDAEIVLYATWGYQTGNANLALYGPTTQEMEMKIRAAYTAIAEELDLAVAYAGAGMTYALAHSNLALYNEDRTHPSRAGSILAALTIFSTIFRVDPATVTYNGNLTDSVISPLKEAASYIYRNGAPVDAAYQTSSIGVSYESAQYSSGIDITKTINLTAAPTSSIISYTVRDSAQTGRGWQTLKSNAAKTFSGIRGDKDLTAATAYSKSTLTDAQKADIADIGYGVSIIGIESVRADKKGTETAVQNLVNGHWGTSYMAAMTFDEKLYDIQGNVTEKDGFTALITLNFGEKRTFDAIGYMSGTLRGFPQVQEVFVSDDGINWTRVDSACYDTIAMAEQGKSLVSVTSQPKDPWNNNTATENCFFDMGGVSGKYIRIGIRIGGDVDSVGIDMLPIQEKQHINTREIVVYGK